MRGVRGRGGACSGFAGRGVGGDDGQYRFNLVATNGQTVAISETYTRKAAALDTIASIQKNASAATVDDQTAGA